MIKDKLLALALFCSLLGIVLLYFLANSMEPAEVLMGELDSHYGETVRVRGTLDWLSVSNNSGTVFLALSSEESRAEAVFFGRAAQKLPDELAALRKGDEVCITGKVSSYKGKTELMGEKLCQ